MTIFDDLILKKLTCETLAELNKWFIKNNTLNKDKFMQIQLKCWRKVKKEFNIIDKKVEKE